MTHHILVQLVTWAAIAVGLLNLGSMIACCLRYEAEPGWIPSTKYLSGKLYAGSWGGLVLVFIAAVAIGN